MPFRFPMLSVRLIGALVILAAPLLAQDSDPFAAYRQTIDGRLSAMLERQSAPPAPPPAAAPALPPRAAGAAALHDFARRYWNGRDADFAAAFARLQQLRPAIESILAAEGVPTQLAAVALVESGARPLALSPKQARGLWQFIPETARRYGLTVTALRDDRVPLESATRAAARYLRDLYGRFGTWPLALAAYNAGENAVQSALEKSRASTFRQLSSARLLPAETRNYVPAVLAAMQLLSPAELDPAASN